MNENFCNLLKNKDYNQLRGLKPMRVHVYESNIKVLLEVCKSQNTTPTKLLNSIILYLESISQDDEATDELFKKLNNREAR